MEELQIFRYLVQSFFTHLDHEDKAIGTFQYKKHKP